MRRTWKILGAVLFGLTLAIGGTIAYLSTRKVDAPYPPIVADLRPDGVARGRMLFEGTCGQCHRAPGSSRAAGAPLLEVPEFLGTFHARNLTRDGTRPGPPTLSLRSFAARAWDERERT